MESRPQVKCPFCGIEMEYRELRGNEFWECPDCKAEFWPYDEEIEKEIRKAMYTTTTKKKNRGGRKKRFSTKKLKWVPWYKRGLT